jgi:hypothetical protein
VGAPSLVGALPHMSSTLHVCDVTRLVEIGGFVTTLMRTTLDLVFIVTYYLKSRNAISIYHISHIISTNVKLDVWQ